VKTIKGPAIFLAQFVNDTAPFNTLDEISRWAAALGYKGVQIPTWDSRLFDLELAARSPAYCDEILGTLRSRGLQLTELSTHLQGQLLAVHPAYDHAFDSFAPDSVRGNPPVAARPGLRFLGHTDRQQVDSTAHSSAHEIRSFGVWI